MADLLVLDGNGNQKIMKATGDGTSAKPLVMEHIDLEAIAAIEEVSNCLSLIVRATNFISTSSAGTIAAGANSVAIANVGDAAGAVKNEVMPAGAAISWSANGRDVLDEISYDATGTTFLITKVV